MNYFSSKEDVFFSSANLHKKIHLSLALSKKLLIFLREEEGKAEAEGKGEAGRKRGKEGEKEEGKAMQPSCTEPNPRGTKGKEQGGGGKEKEKGKGGKGGKRKEGRKKGRKKGKASPKIIGRGYSLASAIDYPQKRLESR